MGLDYKDFKELRDVYLQLSLEYDEFLRGFLIEIGLRALNLTKNRTPTDTGYLKNNWYLGEVKRKGNELYIELINPVEYASFVEDGHFQQPGRYVPAIGKRLVKSFVKGHHMARVSIDQIESEIPARFSSALKRWWESLGVK